MDSQSIAVNREWLDKLQADKAALEQRVGELEAALRLYADRSNWIDMQHPHDGSDWMWDGFDDPIEAAAKALADRGNK
jgi:hypothetical protein